MENLGRFNQSDLADIWSGPEYVNRQAELLQLMIRFKLCYEIRGAPGSYIAPQLLTKNQPDYDWDETGNLFLRYTYDFMPKGILTRFIVEMHRLIADQNLVQGFPSQRDKREAMPGKRRHGARAGFIGRGRGKRREADQRTRRGVRQLQP